MQCIGDSDGDNRCWGMYHKIIRHIEYLKRLNGSLQHSVGRKICGFS